MSRMGFQLGLGMGLAHVPLQGGAFSLASFMASQTDGLWIDTTYTDRFFQENDGPTLADDVGEAIGLALDQRQWGGQTLATARTAATELITNPGPFSVTTGWATGSTPAGTASLSIVSNKLRVTNDTANYGFTAISFSSGTGGLFAVAADAITNGGSQANGFHVGTIGAGSSNIAANETSDGAWHYYYIASGQTVHLTINANGNTSGGYRDITSVSVKRPGGYTALQATGSLQPARQSTGAKFDGTDDNWLTQYLASSGSNFVVALVTVPASLSATQLFFGLSNSGGRFYIGFNTSGYLVGGVGNQGAGAILGSVDLRSTEVVVGLSCDGTTVRLFANTSVAYEAAQDGNPDTTIPARIGAQNSAGTAASPFAGSVKKLVVGRSALTLSRFLQIRSALLA